MNDVVLTDQERQILAEMAARLDDFWLARELVGTAPPVHTLPRPRVYVRGVRGDTPGVEGLRLFFRGVRRWYAAMILLAIGFIIALRGVTVSMFMTTVGMTIMSVGGFLLWSHRRRRAQRGDATVLDWP